MSRAIVVGFFTLSALVILVAGIFIIGRKNFVFNETYEITTEFPNVAGLDQGAEVRVGGLRKGTVRKIKLPETPDRQVMVILSIDKDTRSLIRSDSIASIQTEGLLGNKYISISFGSVNATPVQNGGIIQGQTATDYADLLKKASSVIDQTGEALIEVKTALRTVTRIGGNLESVSAKIDRGEGTIGALVNDRTLYNQANEILNDAHATARTVRATAENLSEKTSEITIEARDAVRDIRQTTSRIATNTEPIMEEAKQGLSNFNENMQALKHNWLFRGFFKDRGYFDLARLTENETRDVPPNPTDKIVLPSKKLFDKPGNADLENKKMLEKIGKQLEQNPPAKVIIGAYTGPAGEAEENLELTRAQAGVVRRFLIEHFGLDEKTIFTKGFGESSAPSGEPDRLEILLYSASKPSSLTQ